MANILKALALEKNVRVYIMNSTDIVNETIKRHDLWPSAASVLGKTMTIASLMGAMLKGEQAITIKIDGNGPIGCVIADANAQGEVRGYVTRPHVNFTTDSHELAEIQTLGYNLYIDVIKDLKMNELFTSSIEIITGDLAKDFTYYFMESEQTPSVVALGSKFDVDNTCLICGGIIIQLLPGTPDDVIDKLEQKISLLNNFSQKLLDYPNLEDIIKMIFESDYEILEELVSCFKCSCNKEKFMGGLISLGKDEIQDIIDNEGKAQVVCHYCGDSYDFNIEELNKLLKEAK